MQCEGRYKTSVLIVASCKWLVPFVGLSTQQLLYCLLFYNLLMC